MTDISKLIHKIQRDKKRRGVYAAAQSLRCMGLSLHAALLLLARAQESAR